MSQRNMLILALLASFALVLLGGVVSRLSSAPPEAAAAEPAVTVAPAPEAVASERERALLAQLEERDRQYRSMVDEANRRLREQQAALDEARRRAAAPIVRVADPAPRQVVERSEDDDHRWEHDDDDRWEHEDDDEDDRWEQEDHDDDDRWEHAEHEEWGDDD